MKNRFKILFLTVLSVFIFSAYAEADVLLGNIQANNRVDQNTAFTTGTIETGSGGTGEYAVIACAAVNPNSAPQYNNPSPGTWTVLDSINDCGGSLGCSSRVWGRPNPNPSSEEITCSWDSASFVFAAGSFRFQNVDLDNPIGDFACNTGTGTNMAVAPSINVEPGSMVLRILTYTLFSPPLFGPFALVDFDPVPVPPELVGLFFANEFTSFTNINLDGRAQFFAAGGSSGSESFTLDNSADWKACSIAIRMAPDIVITRNVPALSEWGLIGFAVLAGTAGLFFLRRRSAVA